MSRNITTQQIVARNRNHPESQWVIIHGQVYRARSIPFKECKTSKSSKPPSPPGININLGHSLAK